MYKYNMRIQTLYIYRFYTKKYYDYNTVYEYIHMSNNAWAHKYIYTSIKVCRLCNNNNLEFVFERFGVGIRESETYRSCTARIIVQIRPR